jgi:hypothetical protein
LNKSLTLIDGLGKKVIKIKEKKSSVALGWALRARRIGPREALVFSPSLFAPSFYLKKK